MALHVAGSLSAALRSVKTTAMYAAQRTSHVTPKGNHLAASFKAAAAPQIKPSRKPIGSRPMSVVNPQAYHPSAGGVGAQISNKAQHSLKTLANRVKAGVRRNIKTKDLIEELGGALEGGLGIIVQALEQARDDSDQEKRQAYQSHIDAIKKEGIDTVNSDADSAWHAAVEEARVPFHKNLKEALKDTSPLAVLKGLMAVGAVAEGFRSFQQTLSQQLGTQQPGNLRAKPERQIALIMLQTVIRLAGALKGCEEMLAPGGTNAPAPASILSQIIEPIIRGQGLNPEHINSIHSSLSDGKNPHQKLDIFNRLITLLKQLPPLYWQSEKQRQADLKTASTMMGKQTQGFERNKLGRQKRREDMAKEVSELMEESTKSAREAVEKFK